MLCCHCTVAVASPAATTPAPLLGPHPLRLHRCPTMQPPFPASLFRRYLFAIMLLFAFFAAGRAFHIFRQALFGEVLIASHRAAERHKVLPAFGSLQLAGHLSCSSMHSRPAHHEACRAGWLGRSHAVCAPGSATFVTCHSPLHSLCCRAGLLGLSAPLLVLLMDTCNTYL